MNRLPPKALLAVLVLTVPLVVVLAAVASVILFRAGYGPLTWGVAPFLVSLLISVVLGVVLGRAASKPDGGPRGEKSPGRRNDV